MHNTALLDSDGGTFFFLIGRASSLHRFCSMIGSLTTHSSHGKKIIKNLQVTLTVGVINLAIITSTHNDMDKKNLQNCGPNW